MPGHVLVSHIQLCAFCTKNFCKLINRILNKSTIVIKMIWRNVVSKFCFFKQLSKLKWIIYSIDPPYITIRCLPEYSPIQTACQILDSTKTQTIIFWLRNTSRMNCFFNCKHVGKTFTKIYMFLQNKNIKSN